MFPRSRRLRTSKEILWVLRRGNRRANGYFSCSFYPKPGTLSRVTVIADTKVSKKAVERNLYKRRSRAILQNYPLRPGDLVVRLRPGVATLTYSQLAENLRQCLRQLA